MGCIQAKEAMVERTRSLRNPPPDLSEEENRVMPAADSAQRAPTVKPSTPASPAAAADSSSSGSKSPSKSPSKPATASAKPAVTFQVEPTEVPLHMDDDEDDADPAVAPTPESPDKSKRTQSWRSASKKSSSKSVSYDGDKAEDSKMADMKTSLALKAKRRGDVFVEHIEQKERYSLAVIPKTDEQKSLIEEALSENILFADLGDEELTLMVATMKSKQIAKGEQLITQGEMGDNFYIVEEGAFEFRVDGKAVGSAKAKASFGELALLYNAPRAATVACVSDGATVWTLPRANFRKIVSSAASRSVGETHRALKSVPLLSELTDSQIEKIVDSVTTVRFEAGDTIIRKGDEGRVFYFIKSGEVNCTKIGSGDDNADLQLGPGEYFGERALMTSEPRAANVIALTDLECIALDKDDFEAHLGPLMERLDRNLGARVLQSLPIFAELSDVERMRLVEDFEEEKFKDGEHIVRQGEPGSRFYIVREGEALVSKKVADEHVHIATLHNGDFFGEGALLKDEPRGADVRAHGDVRVFSLERAAFDRSMQKVKGHLSHHLSMRMDKTDDAVKSKKKQLYENIQMNELDIMRTLGTGTFGRVKLVHHPKLKKAFALKQLQKAAVCAYRQQTNVMSEKNIMELVSGCALATGRCRGLTHPPAHRPTTPSFSACTRRSRTATACTCCWSLCRAASSSRCCTSAAASSRTRTRASTRDACRTRSSTCTTATLCTATSSPRTCSSTRRGTFASWTLAFPRRSPRAASPCAVRRCLCGGAAGGADEDAGRHAGILGPRACAGQGPRQARGHLGTSRSGAGKWHRTHRARSTTGLGRAHFRDDRGLQPICRPHQLGPHDNLQEDCAE
jgi:cAMP-dependent protein kinase regulator